MNHTPPSLVFLKRTNTRIVIAVYPLSFQSTVQNFFDSTAKRREGRAGWKGFNPNNVEGVVTISGNLTVSSVGCYAVGRVSSRCGCIQRACKGRKNGKSDDEGRGER